MVCSWELLSSANYCQIFSIKITIKIYQERFYISEWLALAAIGEPISDKDLLLLFRVDWTMIVKLLLV